MTNFQSVKNSGMVIENWKRNPLNTKGTKYFAQWTQRKIRCPMLAVKRKNMDPES
jgi:hypothetical protein